MSELVRNEIKKLFICPPKDFEKVRLEAMKKRNVLMGEKVYVRASLEIGNSCKNKCKYCGMSSQNEELRRYKMSGEEIKESIDQICETGIKQLHLVSGENEEPIDEIVEIILYAKKRGLSVTSVFGIRSVNDYKKIYNAGASRYIMKFETSNQELFKETKPGNSLQDRIANIELLKEIGFKVGTGTIVGLPGTTLEDKVNDIFLLKAINPDMASSSTFSPNKQSVYRNELAGSIETTLRFISIMRFILRDDVYIPSSSSLGFEGQVNALNHGANVISVHFTPEKYSNLFSMYKSSDRINRQMAEIKKIAEIAKLEIGEYV